MPPEPQALVNCHGWILTWGRNISPFMPPRKGEGGLMTAVSVVNSLELIGAWELPPETGLVPNLVKNPSK